MFGSSSSKSNSGGGEAKPGPSSSSSAISGKSDNGKLNCRFCGKKCDTKAKLTRHEKIHTKRFECDICGHKCATGSELKVHQRVHTDTDERPFKCSICGVGFKMIQHCQRHEQNVHKEDVKKVKGQTQRRKRSYLKKDETETGSDSEVEADVASEDEETYLKTYGERFRRFWRQTEQPLCILGKATVNGKELYLVRLKIPGETEVTSPYVGVTNDNFVLVYANKFKNWFPQVVINFFQEGLILVDVEEKGKDDEKSKDSVKKLGVNDDVDDDETGKVSELPKDKYGLPILDGVDEPLDEFEFTDTSSDDEEDFGIRRLLESASRKVGGGGQRKKKSLRLLSDDDDDNDN